MWTLILIESLIWKATITKIFGQTNAGVVGVVGGFEKVHCLSQSFWFDLAPPEKKKAVDIQRLSFILNWRRDRDSNPRRATNPCRFSRPVHLTTLPSFRIAANILKLILLVNMNAFKARLNEHILS